jgi:hypothetical protein
MYFISSEEWSSKFQDTVSTSNKTDPNSIKKPDRLVLLKEEIDADFENHTKNIEVHLWQNSYCLLSTVGDKCSYYCTLTSYTKINVRAENKICINKINVIAIKIIIYLFLL